MRVSPYIMMVGMLAVVACGFTPVYSTNMDSGIVQSSMADIDIAVIPNREGQVVRNYLIDRLYKNGYPADADYRLVTAPITERTIEIGIDRDDNATRAQLRQETSFYLVRLSDGEAVLSRTIRATSGYNILEGSFTTYVTEQDARQQALRTLADKIIIQLELYFNRINDNPA